MIEMCVAVQQILHIGNVKTKLSDIFFD